MFNVQEIEDLTLFTLSNELRKRDKKLGCAEHFITNNKLNKFNNTRVLILESFYHMTLKSI